MNILYVIFRENIFSPIVKTQVVDVLSHITHQNDTTHVSVLWLKRIDYYFRNRNEINTVKDLLISNNIDLIELPLIVGRFPLNRTALSFVFTQVSKRIVDIIRKNRIDIVHTRGYYAGLLMTKIKESYGGFIHVWDPRSPYLQELSSTYRVQDNTSLFLFWKNAEKHIANNADISVATSDSFSTYLIRTGANVKTIPNNANMTSPQEVLDRVTKQKRYSVCYVGSIGNSWNNIRTYAKLIKRLIDEDDTLFIEMYVLESSAPIVEDGFRSEGIPTDRYGISTVSPDEVGRTISGCLAGLQVMDTEDMRLGIKTVDYISAGVPVICNNKALGASEFVKKTKCGWNIDEVEIVDILREAKQYNKTICCCDYAYHHFSTDIVADLYYKLYRDYTCFIHH